MNKTAEFYIEKLKLQKHPEGGAFSEIYRCDEIITKGSLDKRYSGERSISTSIYFMLGKGEISAFHRIKSDEIWHFYDGCPATVYIIDEEGKLIIKIIGREIENNESFQVVIPRNCWFAAEVNDKDGFLLVGCTVAPGFDFNDFELADKEKLLNEYPEHKALIERLTGKVF